MYLESLKSSITMGEKMEKNERKCKAGFIVRMFCFFGKMPIMGKSIIFIVVAFFTSPVWYGGNFWINESDLLKQIQQDVKNADEIISITNGVFFTKTVVIYDDTDDTLHESHVISNLRMMLNRKYHIQNIR